MRLGRRQTETSPELGPLEKQLRRLPKPKVPEGLEARLIAAIPPAASAGRRHRAAIWRWVAGAGIGAAAVLALSVVLSDRHTGDVDRSPTVSNGGPANPVSVPLASNNTKETDPCNILPPFPDWR